MKSDYVPPPMSEGLAQRPVHHFMTAKPICASVHTTIQMAMKMMLTHKISGMPVLDTTDKVVGVYSELDALLQGASESLGAPIRFTKPAVTVGPEEPFRQVLILLVKKRLRRVPVVDAGQRLLGVVSRRDLMRALADDSKKAGG